jgi:hypothetical protein
MISYDDQQFPVYPYTFTVQKLLFDMGCMEVRFLPTDTALSAIVTTIPIWPAMDITNLKAYLDNFAPHDRWYAQKVITDHGNTILGN